MGKLNELKTLIENYEERKIGLSEIISLIKDLTQKDVTQYDLDNYSASQDLESFCKVLLIESIKDWENIDDKMALILINEIVNNEIDDSVILRNSKALEKRYGKPQGTIYSMIFYDGLDDDEILIELKKDTIIRL
ncbi:hypothetical protein OIU83_21325 [Flavobacterium sp. LS1R49]|uniref:Uncharacterized protein n=1 Tax=Flavobacterium shii TaxID=2987687 RepID=A0A9X2YXR1_9FLAO|nr:hypothetical protein [Flavobacterium shii]MCV9930214.1 hypothetical protein [Flavobacterium shii]